MWDDLLHTRHAKCFSCANLCSPDNITVRGVCSSLAIHRGLASAPLLVCSVFSHVQLFATPWTVAHQAPLSMGFSRQKYWSGLPFPPPGDLPHPRIKPMSPASPALAGRFFLPLRHLGSPQNPQGYQNPQMLKSLIYSGVVWNYQPNLQMGKLKHGEVNYLPGLLEREFNSIKCASISISTPRDLRPLDRAGKRVAPGGAR